MRKETTIVRLRTKPVSGRGQIAARMQSFVFVV